MRGPPKTLKYEGVEYRYRYAYRKDDVLMFVCDTDKLSGKYGDEVAAADVESVTTADGTVVENPSDALKV